jgi:Anthrone oxygenase
MKRENVAAATGVALAGVLTGNEVGTMVAVHPALNRLPMPSRLLAEQAVTRRYGKLMPAMMTATIAATASAGGVAVGPRRRLFRTAAGSYAVMLVLTLTRNVPLNTATLQLPASATAEQLSSLRQRWERLHAVRVALDLLGLALASAAASREAER